MFDKIKIAVLALVVFVLVGFSIYVVNFIVIKDRLHTLGKEKLKSEVAKVHRSLDVQLSFSIKNYLKGIADAQHALASMLYKQSQRGVYSETQAIEIFQKVAGSLVIGKTGYVLVVQKNLNDKLTLAVHPFLRGKDCTLNEACVSANHLKNGYLEYMWENPSDERKREKVAYLREFKPWNWIIAPSSYKDEFNKLADVKDVEETLRKHPLMKTGYYFIYDKDYNIIIHPAYAGSNFKDLKKIHGLHVIDDLTRLREGFYSYEWQNPTEIKIREKYSYIKELKNFNWFLVGTIYIDDINAPITKMGILTAFVTLILCIAITVLFLKRKGKGDL